MIGIVIAGIAGGFFGGLEIAKFFALGEVATVVVVIATLFVALNMVMAFIQFWG